MLKKKLKYLRYNFTKFKGYLLKKITLILLFLVTLAQGDAKLYMGTGLGYANVKANPANSSQEETFSEDLVRLKFGYGDREAYGVEFSLDYINSDPKKYAFDVSLIKAFDWNIYVNPFVKAGFGGGVLDNRDNENQSLTYGNFHAGAGVYVPLGEHFELELSYEYKNRSYQREDEESTTESRSAHINYGYLGINFRY